MCRNIRPLFNYEPPATEEEIYKASLQFVKKISGFQKPSKVNEIAFNVAIESIGKVITTMLSELETKAPPRNRKIELQRARERNAKRFGTT